MEERKEEKKYNAKAQLLAEEKVLDALVGNKASVATRESFRKDLGMEILTTTKLKSKLWILDLQCLVLKYLGCLGQM